MKTGRTLRLALRALLAHRLRVALALSSVAVGVAAVILTSAIGKGAKSEVLQDIEAMGTSLLVVRPAPVKRLVARKEVQGFMMSLKAEDAAAIAELDLVQEAIPAVDRGLRVKAGRGTVVTTVRGTTPAFPDVRNFQIRGGRFFDLEDEQASRRVAVLGAQIEERLFPGENPVGQWIRVRGIPFEVIGVLEAKGVQADGSDEDNQILIPLRTALRRVFNTTWISAVFVSVRDPERMAEVEAGIAEFLRKRHGADDFAVQNRAKMLASRQEMADALTLLTTGLSSLALLVGGTGILALMLLSVKERTAEIGLRMAVGARPRDILFQFLAEATALALGGWGLGVALGAVGAGAVAFGTEWKVGLPVEALLASLGMAGFTGLGFGAFPARKAAGMMPVEALATE